MRMLFVADRIPYPLDRGSSIRVHNILEACAQQFDVTFVAPRTRDQATALLPASVSSAVIVDPAKPPPFSLRTFLRALRCQVGFSMGRGMRSRMQMLETLQQLDLDRFDLIFAERPHIGLLLREQRARTVVDFDDLEHRKLARRLRTGSSLRDRLHDCYRYLVYRHAERRRFRDYLGVYVCSRDDQAFLEAHGARNVRILTNGAAIPSRPQRMRDREPGQPLRLVFVGNLGYAPNVDAIRYFARDVLPKAGALVESFDVIGPNASPELVASLSGTVNFRGFVPDLGAALATYDVMVAPIRFGSGTKLKVLDAMAQGIPLVSTRYGAEGLELADGRSALIADSPEDMIAALHRLTADPSLGRRLAANAYDLARRQFSWGRTQAVLSSELRGLADVVRSRQAPASRAERPAAAPLDYLARPGQSRT